MSTRMIRNARQRGAALIVIAALLAIGVCALLVSALNATVFDHTTTLRTRNAEALQQAKAALVGHVAREVLNLANSVPGLLPCPESPSQAGTSTEGAAAGSCDPAAADKTIGRLPWRTLGIDKLVDGANEPLWYAVAPNWVQSAALPLINSGTAGQLTVDGTGGVVAVIIAPGRPINVAPNANQIAAGCEVRQQVRNDRSHVAAALADPDYRDYLECQNASSPIDLVFGSSVVDNVANLTINDQLVYVTAADVLNAIQGPLAERMQRTVVPLLKEYSELWPGGGSFMPYAVAFAPPESNLPLAQHCGPSANPAQQREGILPFAPNAGPCASTWNGFSVSGSVTSPPTPCATLPSTNVQCSFTYYRFTALGILTLGLLGGTTNTTDVTIQATAPHAAASFRTPLKPSDVTFPPPAPAGVSANAATLVPQADGDARLSLQVRVTGTNVCDNLLIGLTCGLLPGLLVSPTNVTVEFPQLAATTTLQGTRLSVAHPPSFNLHTPLADAPHYWFMQNQWYRYTYYAVSLSASAAGAGGDLTVNGFPAANGNANDKRFVLAAMGPATTGQVRGPAAALNQYIEGDNAATAAAPRVFAYQVHAVSGNDRIATCPFNDGTANACN